MLWRFRKPSFLPSRVGIAAMNTLFLGVISLLGGHYVFQVSLCLQIDLPKTHGFAFLPIGIYFFIIAGSMMYLSWAKKRRKLNRVGEFFYSYVFGDDVEHAIFKEKFGDAPFDIREFENSYKVMNPVLSDIAQIDILNNIHKSKKIAAFK